MRKNIVSIHAVAKKVGELLWSECKYTLSTQKLKVYSRHLFLSSAATTLVRTSNSGNAESGLSLERVVGKKTTFFPQKRNITTAAFFQSYLP